VPTGPVHVAMIMDGNGRWASQRGLPRLVGHRKGAERVREIVTACPQLGITHLTIYAFSTENWNRPVSEVNALMEILVNAIAKETKTFMDNEIQLNAIGDLASLPPRCFSQLNQAIELTSQNKRCTLTLALSYSARWELTRAVKILAEQVKSGGLDYLNISEKTISEALQTANLPDPELLIRTSGEMRLSNFMMWQLAYTELYFTPKLWPDFRRSDLHEAIIDFQKRERRFGKISE
jgi:undecaprenyl diphosphate synthase